MKRNLDRHKNKEYPKNTKVYEEIRDKFSRPEIIEKYGLTYDNDAKCYIETVVEENYTFTVFSSEFVINIVKNHIQGERKYLMDATFDCIPREFYQLLIISVEFMNDVSKSVKSLVRNIHLPFACLTMIKTSLSNQTVNLPFVYRPFAVRTFNNTYIIIK